MYLWERFRMRTVAVVPMKLNNSRLPNKNIKPFTNGDPLCCYILNTLLSVRDIEEVYVYCSSPEIMNYIPKSVKFIQRPTFLDKDSTSMTEVLCEFAKVVLADIYVMTHVTSPFIKSESIEFGLNKVRSGDYDSAFAAMKMQDFLWEDGKPINYSLDCIPRTQDLKALYKETSGFYIYTNDVITKKNRRIGDKPFIVEVSEIEAVDIDEKEDFMIADAIYNHMYKLDSVSGGL